jgi:hypothetical protein
MSFTTFDPSDFVISQDSVVAPAWSGGLPTISRTATPSPTIVNDPSYVIAKSYYIDVYNATPNTLGAEVQFSVAIGDKSGAGTDPLNGLIPAITPTRINYGQFRNMVYGDAEIDFPSTRIAAITINRNRYKESLFPGTMLLNIGGTVYTDNSLESNVINYLDCGRSFKLVQATTPTTPGTGSGDFGLFLPDIGTIIITDPALVAANAGAMATSINLFTLNSQESISSNYAFVRVRNSDYNYTTNPSIITGSGDFVYSNFINSPQTYITTVGLYNNDNDLLAVAKLSKPLVKDFTKEALIRIKLDW